LLLISFGRHNPFSEQALQPFVGFTFGVLPQVVQTVYGGGAVRASAKQAELGYDIALCDEEFSRLDVRYAADYAYWNLSAVELYAASMRQYVSIIRSLKEVVDRRFAEGYIAKGDVLMIETRLSEAEYSLVSAEQSYEVALHNFNILRGTDATLDVQLGQGIRDSLPMPVRVVTAEALARRPDYTAARLRARARDQDRIERMGEAFFTRVREAYLARAAAAPERFLIIDADRPAKDVSADIFARISSWL